MKRTIGDKGRLIIPKGMRKELGINDFDEVNVELHGNKIIITNPDGIRSKEEIQQMLRDIKNLEENDYSKGFKDALTMVLNKE